MQLWIERLYQGSAVERTTTSWNILSTNSCFFSRTILFYKIHLWPNGRCKQLITYLSSTRNRHTSCSSLIISFCCRITLQSEITNSNSNFCNKITTFFPLREISTRSLKNNKYLELVCVFIHHTSRQRKFVRNSHLKVRSSCSNISARGKYAVHKNCTSRIEFEPNSNITSTEELLLRRENTSPRAPHSKLLPYCYALLNYLVALSESSSRNV